MSIQRITDLADLQPFRARWDELSGDCVFRSWTWQTTWWKHYGVGKNLFVLLVFDDEDSNQQQQSPSREMPLNADRLTAILPCYLESTIIRGRVLRLLGDGEVCSDHLGLLACAAYKQHAGEAVAQYLCECTDDWDTTDFTAIDSESLGTAALHRAMSNYGCQVTLTPNQNIWSVPLPADWETFLAMQSKSHRKQLRRLEKRVLDTAQAVWHCVRTSADFEIAWPILIDLHQSRRNSLGEPGCFASERWTNFHHDIAQRLLTQGKLRLSWLEIAGQPVATEYQFANATTTWAYQGGVDPSRLAEEPGRMSLIRSFQQAISEGHRQFDLLRGDEPYKAHWRAEPTATFDIQIVPARTVALWRSEASNYLQRATRMARQITSMLS